MIHFIRFSFNGRARSFERNGERCRSELRSLAHLPLVVRKKRRKKKKRRKATLTQKKKKNYVLLSPPASDELRLRSGSNSDNKSTMALPPPPAPRRPPLRGIRGCGPRALLRLLVQGDAGLRGDGTAHALLRGPRAEGALSGAQSEFVRVFERYIDSDGISAIVTESSMGTEAGARSVAADSKKRVS